MTNQPMWGSPMSTPAPSNFAFNPNAAPATMNPYMQELMRQYMQNMNVANVPNTQPTMAQPQQMMPLCGRTINAEAEVKPNEVPMDGTMSYFPLADGSSIISKSWAKDGTIKTEIYVKQDLSAQGQNGSDAEPTPVIPDRTQEIIDRLTSIEEALKAKTTKSSLVLE